jgi:hypothetical protein
LEFLAEYDGPKLYSNQVLSMLKRNALNVWRNKARTVTPVVVSLLLFALFVGFGRFSGSFKSEQLGKFSMLFFLI